MPNCPKCNTPMAQHQNTVYLPGHALNNAPLQLSSQTGLAVTAFVCQAQACGYIELYRR
jgi:predicted nucleic-acid-binding Zn-ribbon protein